MLRNKRPKLIENEVVNAKKLFRLGTLSEQKWVWAWVLIFSVFQRPSWSRQNSIWTAFLVSKWGPKTVLQSVFSRFQLRDTIIEKNAPLPGENHVFACWRGPKMGRFEVSKSIKNRYFFDIHLGSDFCWFFLKRKWRFWGAKTEAKFQQKSISRRFAWNVKKGIAQAVFRDTQPLGPEASPGGLGAYLVLYTY